MKAYIAKDEAIHAYKEAYAQGENPLDWIEAIEEADVVEQRYGKWERHYVRPGVYADLFWHCSACGGKVGDNYACMYHYCPDCGAKMITVNCDS